jgi:hypothetical protein
MNYYFFFKGIEKTPRNYNYLGSTIEETVENHISNPNSSSKNPPLFSNSYQTSPETFSLVPDPSLNSFDHSSFSKIPSNLPPNPNNKYSDEFKNFFQFIHMFPFF